jgi:succinyl-CoA synthetase alpha subunit
MSILIDETTTFIVQGITGREAVNLTRECLDYGQGAKVVGGVTPGRLGREVHGVPVFDTVEQAVKHHGGMGGEPCRRRSPRTRSSRPSRTASRSS